MEEQSKESVEREDIQIEGSTATWNINSVGDVNGSYIGKFKFKCIMLPTDKIAAGREYRALLGANPTMADENDSWLAWCLSQLKYRVLEYPPFWNTGGEYMGNIPDVNIITEVLNAAVDSELKYKKQIENRKLSAIDRAKLAAEKVAKNKKEDAGEDVVE